MDQYWQAVAEFLNSHDLRGADIVAPVELREIFPVRRAYGEVMASDADAIDVLVLHKGCYQKLDRPFTRAALARLHPSFANEVFIVLTARSAALEDTNPHLGYMKEISLWAAQEESAKPPAPPSGAAVEPVLRRVALARWWDELRSCPRALDPLRLTRFGRKTFSQNDEDGIILEIFNRIGVRSRRFVEFGVEGGVECNTALLLAAGWSGLWLDGVPKNVIDIQKRHAHAIGAGRLTIKQAFVSAENINQLLGDGMADPEIDLLSIDIDFNDYWVWKAIDAVNPRVVIVEYNASYPPPLDFVVAYDPEAIWNTTNYCGASLTMLEKLGRKKGYSLVGCCLAGVNAFFVRNDELTERGGAARFHAPFTAAEHYEPPRYELSGLGFGHKPGFGPNAAAEEAGL